MSSTFALPVTSCSNSGHGLHVHAQGLERAQDLAPAPARQRRQRQQDAVDVAVLDERRQLLRRVDLDAVDHAAVQAAVIVDEHQRVEGARGRQDGRQPRPRIARAVDGHARLGRLDVAGQKVVAHHETRARDVEKRQAGIDRHDAPRQRAAVRTACRECRAGDPLNATANATANTALCPR